MNKLFEERLMAWSGVFCPRTAEIKLVDFATFWRFIKFFCCESETSDDVNIVDQSLNLRGKGEAELLEKGVESFSA